MEKEFGYGGGNVENGFWLGFGENWGKMNGEGVMRKMMVSYDGDDEESNG